MTDDNDHDDVNSKTMNLIGFVFLGVILACVAMLFLAASAKAAQWIWEL